MVFGGIGGGLGGGFGGKIVLGWGIGIGGIGMFIMYLFGDGL